MAPVVGIALLLDSADRHLSWATLVVILAAGLCRHERTIHVTGAVALVCLSASALIGPLALGGYVYR